MCIKNSNHKMCQQKSGEKTGMWKFFFDVNGVNGCIREPSNSAVEDFLWHIHAFSDVNSVNGKVEKKNWDMNIFFNVNSFNGKNTKKIRLTYQFFDVNGVNGKVEKKIGMWKNVLMSTASTAAPAI